MAEKFITVAIFQYPVEAEIIKGRLESEGIKVFMFDDFTIGADPLTSIAVGGVKLKVFASQEEEAKTILNAINKYSVDNEGNSIICPQCKSEKIDFFTTVKDKKSMFWFLVGIFTSALPFYEKHTYRCQDCNTEFDLK